jgi:serine O-acetyltransferase
MLPSRWLVRTIVRRGEQHPEGFFGMLVQVREDLHAHQNDRTLPGFRALAVHRFGNWVLRLRRGILRSVSDRVYRILYLHVRNHYGIELPRSTAIGRRLRIGHQGAIIIHPLSRFGDDCVIRQNVTIGAANAETPQKAPILMDRVEVGCGAVIVGAVTIGNDARIGPNVVVTTNVPEGAILVGAPPRLISLRQAPPPVSRLVAMVEG